MKINNTKQNTASKLLATSKAALHESVRGILDDFDHLDEAVLHLRLDLNPSDAAQLFARAEADGLRPTHICRRVIRNFLISRPYLTRGERLALRSCIEVLGRVLAEVKSSQKEIELMVSAGFVEERFLEIAENDARLAAKLETFQKRIQNILEQAESRRAIGAGAAPQAVSE